MKFQTGSVFGNRYTLGERIAVGGMGEVWRAEDRVLGRSVAMKLLSPSLADQPGFTRRFREEARNTAMLSHPNIAAVYDYGEDAGASWLVMELVEGEPLSQIIKEEGSLPSRRVSAIMAQAALALQAAHDAGVIHRDVKPANILIRNDGQVKLTDFGIARATDAAPITRTGEVMGTAQYISPEQATGKPAGPASDLYSLGVVGHEMLTGKRPFDEGSPVATAMAHIHNPPPPLPDSVDPVLAGVIFACLAKDPSARPPSARAVTSALRGGPEAAALLATQVMPPGAGATQRMGAAPTMAQPPAQLPPGYPPAGYPTGTYQQGYQPYPPGYAPTGPMPEQRKRSNPWPWIMVAVLVVALVGVVLAQSGLFNGGGQTPNPTPTTASPTTSASPTQTMVLLDSTAFRGMTPEQASARLRSLGFTQITRETQSDANVPAGRVISVTPSGDVVVGRPITLIVSSGPAQTTPPTTPPTSAPTTTDEPSPSESTPSDTGGGDNGNNGNQTRGAAAVADTGSSDGSTDARGSDTSSDQGDEGDAQSAPGPTAHSGGVAGAHAGVAPDNGANPTQGQSNSADQGVGSRNATAPGHGPQTRDEGR